MLFSIIISIALGCLLLASPISGSINVWPMPRNFSWPQPQANPLSPNFNIISPDHRYLSSAAKRYQHLILTEHHRPLVNPSSSVRHNTSAPPLLSLAITVISPLRFTMVWTSRTRLRSPPPGEPPI
ncbi:hypothetical protein ACLB2K_051143 [Fragaria x ananassa]